VPDGGVRPPIIFKVTDEEADFVVSAAEVAFTVHVVSADKFGAAVKLPDASIVPRFVGLTVHVTEVFVVPLTVAVNC
jgi:hypothetical protein